MLQSDEDEEPGFSLISAVNDIVWKYTGKGQEDTSSMKDIDLNEEKDLEVDPSCTYANLLEEGTLSREVRTSVVVVLLLALVCGVAVIACGVFTGEAHANRSQGVRPSIHDGAVEISVEFYTEQLRVAPQKEVVWTEPDPPATTPSD